MAYESYESFESVKGRLAEIVDAVSNDDLPLDQALSLYEEAVGLGLRASDLLEQGIDERRCEQALAEEDGVQEGSAQPQMRRGRHRPLQPMPKTLIRNERRCMSDNRILDIISSPADLKLLSNEELSILASEIRQEIVSVTSKTGGHVASSLGAVEIILALHSLLDCPKDKIVFDVGHQAYAHKLVTGRLKDFPTLRTYGGMSGFPKPSESPYDVHYSGHASDSLSVALGLAEARDLSGADNKVVALIGDAALSGGMAFEALNNIGQAQTPMVIILNDNEMSISHNVGALVKHLGYMRASSQYRQARDTMQEHLESSGPWARR